MYATVIAIAAVRMPLPMLSGEQERDHDREQQEREREHRVHDQDEDAVELPAEVAGEQAERDADREREEQRDEDDLELGPRAPRSRGKDVRRLDGRAHQMVAGRRRELREPVSVRAGTGRTSYGETTGAKKASRMKNDA